MGDRVPDQNNKVEHIIEFPNGDVTVSASLNEFKKLTETPANFEDFLFTTDLFPKEGEEALINPFIMTPKKNLPVIFTSRISYKQHIDKIAEEHTLKPNLVLNKPEKIDSRTQVKHVIAIESPMVNYHVVVYLNNYSPGLKAYDCSKFLNLDDVLNNTEIYTGFNLNDWRNLDFWEGLFSVMNGQYADAFRLQPDMREFVEQKVYECNKQLNEYVKKELQKHCLKHLHRN